MNSLVVGVVGFGGVLFGYLVGLLVGSRNSGGERLNSEGVLCYECKSRVDPEFVEENDAHGFPECPVCSGNMLPPVGEQDLPEEVTT